MKVTIGQDWDATTLRKEREYRDIGAATRISENQGKQMCFCHYTEKLRKNEGT